MFCALRRGAVAAGFLVFAAFSAVATENTLFISEVSVDATGDDATQARATAMAMAEKEGLVQLLDKLAPDQKEKILAGLDAPRISGMVRGTEVLEEKILGSRYRGNLRVSYAADAINKLIDRKISAVGGEDDTRLSTLMIPLLEQAEGSAPLLWETTNSWRSAWQEVGVETASGHVIVPYGDTVDTGSLQASAVLAGNYSLYLPLIRRYGVRDVTIALARIKDEGRFLEVVKRKVDRIRNEVTLLSYQSDPQETPEMLMRRAARDIAEQARRTREELATARAMEKGQQGKQMVVARFATIQEWRNLRDTLKSVPLIDRIELVALASRQADMMISFRGTPEALMQAAAVQGIRFTPVENYWVLEGL